MLRVKNLVKNFNQQTVIKNISFSLTKGEVVGFLGPNGAGKTTTMRLITGFLRPNGGEIKILGLSPQKAKSKIGYLPEENPLYERMTPLEYLSFLGQMHQLEPSLLEERLRQLIKIFELPSVITTPIGRLSRGFRQRVGLAATMIHDPPLIIMDEPTSGLDPLQQREIKRFIKKIAKEKAIIFSTHILSEVKEICQRAIIIHQGKIVADTSLEQLKKRQQGLEKLFYQLTGNA